MDPTLSTIVGALIAAVGALWKHLSFVHAKLSKRSDECEEDRNKIHETLSEVKQDLAVFKACPAPECPAQKGRQRAGTFQIHKEKRQ